MGPRRRWRRRAAKAALAALVLALLGLLASGGGEELLAAALAAWGEGRGEWGEGWDEWEWGMGAGEAGGAGGGGVFINGGRGKGAWLADGEGAGLRAEGAGVGNEGAGLRARGAGLRAGGAGLWAGVAGVGNKGAGVGNEGAGGGKGGAGVLNGSSGVSGWGPGASLGGPAAPLGGPAAPLGGPGGSFGGPGSLGGPAAPLGGPRLPPACSDLLSGGSGDLHRGPPSPPRSPPTPRVLLSPPPCATPAPFLLLLVPSAPRHRERRLAVRDTWGSPWKNSSRTLFVLGVPPDPPSRLELLAESRQHGDILQGDFADAYANLTLKTLLLLRWAGSCCPGSPFLLKADDDVFVNVPAVATYLATWPAAPPPRLYLGRVHWAVAPNRDPRSRHHVPVAIYPAPRFPPYCSGTAYVLSRQAATAVLRGAGGGGEAWLALPEDVWVGLSARRAGVSPRHSARFGGSWRFPPERCCLGRALFSAHRLRPPEMRRVWGEIGGVSPGVVGVSPGVPGGCGGWLGGWLGGVLRCRAMALGEWLWGGGGGGE